MGFGGILATFWFEYLMTFGKDFIELAAEVWEILEIADFLPSYYSS